MGRSIRSRWPSSKTSGWDRDNSQLHNYQLPTIANSQLPTSQLQTPNLEIGNWESHWELGIGSWEFTSESPPRPILSLQELIRILVLARRVRDSHVRAVIQDLPAGAQRRDAEQHHLGQRRGILERARDLLTSLDRVDPVHLVIFVRHAAKRLLRRGRRVVG